MKKHETLRKMAVIIVRVKIVRHVNRGSRVCVTVWPHVITCDGSYLHGSGDDKPTADSVKTCSISQLIHQPSVSGSCLFCLHEISHCRRLLTLTFRVPRVDQHSS